MNRTETDILQLKSKLWWIKLRNPDTVFFFVSYFLIGWLGESDRKKKERNSGEQQRATDWDRTWATTSDGWMTKAWYSFKLSW